MRDSPEQQWTAAEWTDWRAGGWKRAGNSTSGSAATSAEPRDEQRDAATADIRQELQEVQALKAQHAKTKNPCPEIAKMLEDRAVALRLKLDDSKLPGDLYALDKKKLGQLQERSTRLLEQNTQAWADINEAIESAKERDKRYLATMAQVEELEAAIPARALAAGVKPPQPELETAVGAIQRQNARDTAAATSSGPLADIMRAANAAMEELQKQMAAAQDIKRGMAKEAAHVQVHSTADGNTNSNANAAGSMEVDATANLATNDVATPASTITTTATTVDNSGVRQSVPEAAQGAVLAPASQPTPPPQATAKVTVVSEAERGTILRRAQEASTARDGDSKPIAKARSALRARVSQQPEDYEWLRRGTKLVDDEAAKQKGTGAPAPVRPRSRSRSGGTSGDENGADEDH